MCPASVNGLMDVLMVCVCAGRQFKEAARIAAEMKVLSEEVSHAQEKLSDCELTLAEKNRELSVVSEQLAAAREEGALLERKEGRPWLPHGRRGGGGTVCVLVQRLSRM